MHRIPRRYQPVVEVCEGRSLLSTITTTIGVGSALDPLGTTSGPYPVNAVAPASLELYVFSKRLPNGQVFRPVSQINPRSVIVRGVAFPNATLTRDPIDQNFDGIPDAIITIRPRSALTLSTDTTSLTTRGKTSSGDTWTGTTSIAVSRGITLGRSVLEPGGQLDFSNPANFSNALISRNQQFIAILQTTDGNFTIYPFDPVTRQPNRSRPLWTARIAGKGATVLAMQNTDGNLVAYTNNLTSVWSSRTNSPRNASAYAILTDTGKLQIIRNNVILFST